MTISEGETAHQFQVTWSVRNFAKLKTVCIIAMVWLYTIKRFLIVLKGVRWNNWNTFPNEFRATHYYVPPIGFLKKGSIVLLEQITTIDKRQKNGQWFKSITFKLPIVEDKPVFSLQEENQAETVVLMARASR